MDEAFAGCVAVVAFLGLLALAVGVIVFAAVMHAWTLLAVEGGLLALLGAFPCVGRDRQPRERREVQKGARWP